MIKLQLLLCHPAQHSSIDPALRARLAAHGVRVTACGRASISAEMAPSDAHTAFGALPPLDAGFGPLSAPALPVPPDLADAIALITLTPSHTPTSLRPPA